MAIVGVSMSFDLAKVPRLVPLHSSSLTCNSAVFLGAKRIQLARWEGSSRRTATMSVNARFGSSKGAAGLMERLSFDQSLFEPMTQVKKAGDIGSLNARKREGNIDRYRVLLVDDIHHTEQLVAQILPKVVPSVTMVGAMKLFHESREKGAAIVIVTVMEHAEFYSYRLNRRGLRSVIELDDSSSA